ncbi:MAG: carboxypeptidase regulatory-like domain-containing protein, partial [Gemmatimonadota bacterium]
MSKRLLAIVLLLAVHVPQGAQAQLVRGTVREAGTGAPLAGVVVSIQRPEPGRPEQGRPVPSLVATLTNAGGEYAISPNDTGRFTLTAKRIGARQFQSPTFTLARGQTHALDITLDPVRFDLPTVTVSGVTPCRARAEDRGRIAALWEEARTAISASELSLRDRLFRATMTRYQRELEPRRLVTRSETQDVRRGVTEHAFVSVPAESLAAHGYARVLPDQVVEYFAP